MNTVVEQKEPELGDTDSRAESVGVLYHVSVGGEVWSVDLADVFEQRLVGATCGHLLTPQEAEH
jgi:hypothetical protein